MPKRNYKGVSNSSKALSDMSAAELNESYSSDDVLSSEISFNSSSHNIDSVTPTNNQHPLLEGQTSTVNKVVSSNPTLNLLLSTPIANGSNGAISPSVKTNRSKKQIQNIDHHLLNSHKVDDPVNNISVTQISFLDEIRKMMHSFGDCKSPLVESAVLIESIVQYQMCLLLNEAEKVAMFRGSQLIGAEEFLFLLKNDLQKLARLIRYLKFKDMKLALISTAANGGAGGESAVKMAKTNIETLYTDCESASDLVSENLSQLTHSSSNLSKRVKICQNFLSSIDVPCRSFSELFKSDGGEYMDEITWNRNKRLNEFTQNMNKKDYCYFQSCRTVNFVGIGNGAKSQNKFQEWVFNSAYRECFPNISQIKLNTLGWEIVQYFAYETVAILVELALVVRNDQQRQNEFDHNSHGLHPFEFEQLPAKKFCQANSLNGTKRTLSIGSDGRSVPNNVNLIQEVLSKASENIFALQSSKPVFGRQRSNSSCSSAISSGNDSSFSGLLHSSQTELKFRYNQPLTPNHILEAMRRFEQIPNIFSRWSRSHSTLLSSNARKRILCL